MTDTAAVPVHRCGTLSLDIETRTLSGPRGQIRLDPMAYAMMCRLMRRPGVIVSDTDMISTVWPDPDDEPDDPDMTLRFKATVMRNTIIALGCGGHAKVSLRRERNVGYFMEVRGNGDH